MAGGGGLVSPDGRYQVAVVGVAIDVDLTGAVHLHGSHDVRQGAAQEGGVHHYGIDGERLRPVIRPYHDGHHVAREQLVPAGDLAAKGRIRGLLVEARPLLHQTHATLLDYQVAFRAQAQTARALELQPDAAGIRARVEDKIVLELVLVAVVDHVDAGINCVIADAGVVAHIFAPLGRVVAEEVAGTPRQRLEARGDWRAIGVEQGNAGHAGSFGAGAGNRQRHSMAGQEHAAVTRPRGELNLRIPLALVRFEVERQVAEHLAGRGGRGRRGAGSERTG